MAFLNETGLSTFKKKCDSYYLKLSGGTMTGSFYVSVASGDVGMITTRTDTNKRLGFIVGSGGQNRGIYDHSKGNWLVYSDANNVHYFTGNADTASALTTSAGSVNQPVYFSNGKPTAAYGTWTGTGSPETNAGRKYGVYIQY